MSKWEEVYFTDVFDISGGTQPPKSEFVYTPQDGYVRLLQIRDFGSNEVPTFIPDLKKLKKCDTKDVLIGRYGASVGKILTGKEGAYNVAIAKVIVPEGINKRYVYHLLKSSIFQNEILSIQRSAQNGFNKEDLAKITIPIAPLNEQKRIADKLDKAFEYIDKVKARMDAIPELLKEFRKMVLSQAVSGKLTEEWRKDNDSGEWIDDKLGNYINKIQAGKNFKCPEIPVENGTVGLVKISAVTWGTFDEKETKTVIDVSKINEELFIKPGDFLISRANTIELVGASVIVTEINNDIMISDKVWRVTFNESVEPYFIDYYLKSSKGRHEIESRAAGTQESMRNISQKAFKDIDISIPLLAEQEEIVSRIKQLFLIADKAESKFKQVQEQLNDLPNQLLAKAFKGELVRPDANDEPAEILLERIKEEMEKLKPTKRKRTLTN